MGKFLSKNPYVAVAILGGVWIAYAVYLAYPRVEILLSGEKTTAEILEVSTEEAAGRHQASDDNLHVVLIDGKKHELILQDSFPKGEIDILWVSGKRHAVVTKNDDFTITDLLGGVNNTFSICVTSLLIIFGLPYMLLNIRKRTRVS